MTAAADTLIAGHRGAKGLAPENTVEAFEKAIALGADMVELDVRRTADGALAVCHDSGVGSKMLRDISLDELRAIAPNPVSTLDEILRLCAGRIKVDIELKERGCEEDALRAVSENIDGGEVVVTSFIDEVVARVKKIDPSIRTGLLVGLHWPNPLSARLRGISPFRRCRRARADIIAPHYKLLRFGFLRRARRHGLPVYVWTVNEAPAIRALIERGVAAVITDYPDRAVGIKSQP